MRKVYLDWLRGVAVIAMVGAHVTDAWTLDADKQGALHMCVVFVAGLAAPAFLFLAGLTLAMAAAAKSSSLGHAASAALARRRGWQVFALAFIFRLQSQLLGWGALSNVLKVDILNVMGLSMVAAGALWGISASRAVRLGAFAVVTTALTMLTPTVREWGWLAALPDPIEAYLRPIAGRTTFTIFPWSGFLFAGVMAGELVSAARTRSDEIRLHAGLFVAGMTGIVAGSAASLLPSIYPVANFWTSSPTFFFIRLGICAAMVPIARGIDLFHGVMRARFHTYLSSPDAPGKLTATLGRSSLFVYWIHVEMVYGVMGKPLRRSLPLEASLTATVILCLILYALVLWKDRLMSGVKLMGAWRIVAPVLK